MCHLNVQEKSLHFQTSNNNNKTLIDTDKRLVVTRGEGREMDKGGQIYCNGRELDLLVSML